MENIFWGFLIFSLGFITGSVLIALTFPQKNNCEIKERPEKDVAENDNPFEDDPEVKRQKEKFINFFS